MSLADTWKEISGSASAVSRYVGTYGAGFVTAAAFAGLKAEDAKALVAAIQQLGDAVVSGMGALATIGSIAAAAYAAWKSTRTQQAMSVAVNPPPGTVVKVDENVAPATLVVAALDDNKPGIELKKE